jgi:hypothetical protein
MSVARGGPGSQPLLQLPTVHTHCCRSCRPHTTRTKALLQLPTTQWHTQALLRLSTTHKHCCSCQQHTSIAAAVADRTRAHKHCCSRCRPHTHCCRSCQPHTSIAAVVAADRTRVAAVVDVAVADRTLAEASVASGERRHKAHSGWQTRTLRLNSLSHQVHPASELLQVRSGSES